MWIYKFEDMPYSDAGVVYTILFSTPAAATSSLALPMAVDILVDDVDNSDDNSSGPPVHPSLVVNPPQPGDPFSSSGTAQGTATDPSTVSGVLVNENNLNDQTPGTPRVTSPHGWSISFNMATTGPSFLMVSGDTTTLQIPVMVIP
jgi:hypothetical protein